MGSHLINDKQGWYITDTCIYEYYLRQGITDEWIAENNTTGVEFKLPITEDDLLVLGEFYEADNIFGAYKAHELLRGYTDVVLFIIPLVNVSSPVLYEGEIATAIWEKVTNGK
jgi:hypothetical protein